MHCLSRAGTYVVEDGEPTYIEHLRVPHLSVGTYSIPAGAPDPQAPHTEDEVYVVVSGNGTLWTPNRQETVEPGAVLFVPAGEPHRFENATSDLCVIVLFGPAEHTRSDASNLDDRTR